MRKSWDDYFMDIVELVKERSTCLRRQVGALIVKDKRILSTGYNGAPMDVPHCDEVGCLRQELNVPSGTKHELCRAVHAEQNAIVQAALYGVSLKGSTLYITDSPCVICAKLAINAGIKKVVYKGNYPDELAKKLLDEAKVEMVKYT